MNASKIAVSLDFFYDNADVRIRDKPFMGTPYAIVTVYLCYVIIIAKILPKIMENRKPWNYRKFMSYVDVILWTRSGYFFFSASYLYLFHYNWSCQPINRSGDFWSTYEMENNYWFVMTKIVYTLQSVVFVTCKKDASVGTYLLIHHTIFPLMLWIGINFYPGGHVVFIGLINTLVHFTGATNRIISAIFNESSYRRFAKLFDIYMHIFQFLAIIIHGAQLLLLKDCSVPKALGYYEIFSALIIAALYNHYVLGAKERREKNYAMAPKA